MKNITAIINKTESADFEAYSEIGRRDTYLLIVFQSKALFSYDGKNYFNIPKNSIIIYSPYHLQAYKSDKVPFVNSFMAFWVEESYFKKLKVPLNVVFSCTQEKIDSIINKLDIMSFILNTPYEPTKRGSIPERAHEVIRLVDAAYAETQAQGSTSISNQAFFSDIRTEMMKNPVRYSVKEMARVSGYTETYFGICYKKYFGITPIKDRQTYLIKLAKEYLETSNYSIEKIAETLKLESVPYFVTLFKKYENVTPHQYRIRLKKS